MSAPENTKDNSSKNKQPTALVAGGAGFIGSHLVKTLITQNLQVICVDNLSTGRKENLREVLTSPNLTFIQEDISNPNFKLPAGLKIDYCFHLASSEEYRQSVEFSLDTLLVNSLGTRQLLEIALSNEAKFVLASSADLYSGAISSSSLRFYFGKSPEDEAILSLHEAKRFAEALAFEYYKKFKLPVTIIRLKDVYGPKMNFDRGDEIAQLLKNALDKEPLKVYGDGLKTLNPTYVSDVVFGMIKAAFGNFSGEIFVLVSPEKITVESFAQTVKLVAGPLEIEHKKPVESFESPFIHLDMENTKEKLSWSPKVALTEGISSLMQSERLESDLGETKSGELKPLEITVPEVRTQVAKEFSGKLRSRNWFRLGIFLASLLLLIATVVYPVTAVGINSFLGRSRLSEAVVELRSERTESTVSKATSAQNSFESAAKNLQSVSWLLKIIGLNTHISNLDHLLQAGANLSEAVRNSARANQILIDSAGKDSLGSDEALSVFNEVLSKLYSSQDRLEQTQLLLETVDWSVVPVLIAPERDFMFRQTQELGEQVDQIIDEVEKYV